MQEAFDQYLNTSHKDEKLLMNATRRAIYLQFLSDPDHKIVEPDKYEKTRLQNKRSQAINEFCINNRGHLLHVGLRKKDITWPQAFVYDGFHIIVQIYVTGRHNRYEITYQGVKNEAY